MMDTAALITGLGTIVPETLSRRDHMAITAMHGLMTMLVNPEILQSLQNRASSKGITLYQCLADEAIRHADELLERLRDT